MRRMRPLVRIRSIVCTTPYWAGVSPTIVCLEGARARFQWELRRGIRDLSTRLHSWARNALRPMTSDQSLPLPFNRYLAIYRVGIG